MFALAYDFLAWAQYFEDKLNIFPMSYLCAEVLFSVGFLSFLVLLMLMCFFEVAISYHISVVRA